VQDCLRILTEIHSVNGIMLGPRPGHRKDEKSDNWGGYRLKKPDNDFVLTGLHSDAEAVLKEGAELSAQIFLDVDNSSNEECDDDGEDSNSEVSTISIYTYLKNISRAFGLPFWSHIIAI
jgi:hypothetical protein